MDVDGVHLAHAWALGGRGEATCRPNPAVGCVLVQGGLVVGEGWHVRAGGPHAEVMALADAGGAAHGATAYVTLEPCDHTGRTGPCSLALLDAGVARVVVGRRDPVAGHGGGVERLHAAGVEVVHRGLDGWEDALPARWLRREATGRPWVTLKAAARADGSMDTRAAERWITGPVARRRVHAQRARHDAVLVGVGTLLGDDPRLDVRDAPLVGAQPVPVVIDSDARTPPGARVVARGGVVVVGDGAAADRIAALRAARATVTVVARGEDGRIDLAGALAALAAHDLLELYAEPGPTLGAAFARAGLVDELVVHRPRDAHDWPAAWHAGTWSPTSGMVLGADREDVMAPVPSRAR